MPDKLDAYLDRVCRGIAGPRSLRAHIRKELREHLQDAAAEHSGAGLPESDALDKALEEFGGPDDLRAQLEATHGHRLLPLILDKALTWKERTMKARWLWSTAAHILLALTLLAELAFLISAVIFILPKFNELVKDQWINITWNDEWGHINAWSWGVLTRLRTACEYYLYFLAALALAWALFEWRVKSENKTLMRLAGMGALALTLGVVVFLTGTALVLPLMVATPFSHELADRTLADAIPALEPTRLAMEKAAAEKDWPSTRRHAIDLRFHLSHIRRLSLGTEARLLPDLKPRLDALHENLKTADQSLTKISNSYNNPEEIQSHLTTFRTAYKQITP